MKCCLTLMITTLLIAAGPSFAEDKTAWSGSGEIGFFVGFFGIVFLGFSSFTF